MADRRPRWSLSAVGSWLGTSAVLLVWFLTLAPTSVGGPATFVVVSGRSMEPALRSGDVVVAHRQPAYATGDLVVYRTEGGGFVIHRLVGGSAAGGWRSKGDHNAWVDGWTVSDASIAGRYWFSLPGVGAALAWTLQHPLWFGAAAAALTAAAFVPLRRPRLDDSLAAALRTARREPRPHQPGAELVVLVLAGLAALAAGAMAVLGHTAGVGGPMTGLAGAAAVAAAGCTWWLYRRRYDGVGQPEPTRSMIALAGLLWLVTSLPEREPTPTPVADAVGLRRLAERHRLPVLHAVDARGAHHFLLITARHGSYRWQPPAPAATRAASGQLSERI